MTAGVASGSTSGDISGAAVVEVAISSGASGAALVVAGAAVLVSGAAEVADGAAVVEVRITSSVITSICSSAIASSDTETSATVSSVLGTGANVVVVATLSDSDDDSSMLSEDSSSENVSSLGMSTGRGMEVVEADWIRGLEKVRVGRVLGFGLGRNSGTRRPVRVFGTAGKTAGSVTGDCPVARTPKSDDDCVIPGDGSFTF